jgi:hypothetical protein
MTEKTYGTAYSGVDMGYIKSRGVVTLTAHYDSGYGGMEMYEVPLAIFLRDIGVPAKDIKKAYIELSKN